MSFLARCNTTPVDVFDIFDDFIEGRILTPRKIKSPGPLTDIKNTGQGFEIKMVVPGVPKDEIKIDIDNNIMTISYKETDNSKYVRSFKKSWTLPDKSDIERITAKADNGIITISVPKEEASITPQRTISIQ